MTTTKSYPKMPTGVQTRARAASGDDGVVFDPALWELDPTGNVLGKVVFCRPEQRSPTNSYVDDNICWLVSSLPSLFYTMSSHRDIYI
jgi:hypothetical protein